MDDENERTLYVGNLSEQVSEEHLWELFLQAGPLVKVKIPSDKDGSNRKTFGFVTFKHSVSVPYTISLMDGVRLYGKILRLQNRSGSRPSTPTTPVDQRAPPVRSFSAPYPREQPPAPLMGMMSNAMDAMGPQFLMQQLGNVPLSLPPPMAHMDERNSVQFGQYNQHGMSRDRSRHERSHSERHTSRFDPRNSRDYKNGRDRGNERDRDGPRHHNSLQSRTNFNNPHQRHMQPSPRRRH